MWVGKKQLVAMEERIIAQLSGRMEGHKRDFHTKPQLYCEECGCLLQREMAVAGEPVIIKGTNWSKHIHVIHYPFFCKKHFNFPEHP